MIGEVLRRISMPGLSVFEKVITITGSLSAIALLAWRIIGGAGL